MKLVFISSTFKDMQFERDKLNTFVVPLINDNISQFGEQTYFGDLRWGVDTSNLTDIESSKVTFTIEKADPVVECYFTTFNISIIIT